VNYCDQCGSKGTYRIPQGDDRPRFICDNCQTIHYQNPKLVVGCIPIWEDRLLMCRRAIQPRYGKWTIPAGFLEIGETVEEGAIRETYEEAGAKVEIIKPYALYNLSFIGQVYLIFLSRLVDSNFRTGYESLEVRLLEAHEIVWNELAFPVIREVLKQYFKDTSKEIFNFYMDDITPEMNQKFMAEPYKWFQNRDVKGGNKMTIVFNADEIFEMAIRMENNAADFYRKAASLQSDTKNQKFLEGLAGMEVQHQKIFTEIRTTLTEKEKDPKVFDPYDEVSQYLAAMVDTMGREGSPSVADSLTGDETLEEILRTAIGLEKDTILFYLGIKDLIPLQSGQNRIDEIIREERRHVIQLSNLLKKLQVK